MSRTIAQHGMLRAGDRVLVALSGGPDSVALTRLLLGLRARLGIDLAVAHLDHRMRTESGDDSIFCAALAKELSLPFTCDGIDLAALARRNGRSLEDEGRRCRYGFLERAARELDCNRIALGHTRDDQAETLLLRLLRGSGAKGLGAVYPVVEGARIRPLLETPRAEILDYLESNGFSFLQDASNQDLRFTRNRLRHETLPHLRASFNPRLDAGLSRAAAILRDEDDYMEGEVRATYPDVVVRSRQADEGQSLSVSALLQVHPALRRRLLREAARRVRGDLRDLAWVHVADALQLLETGKSGRHIRLPGLIVERDFDLLSLRSPECAALPSGSPPVRPARTRFGEPQRNTRGNGYNGFEYRLRIPGQLRVAESGGTLTAKLEQAGCSGSNDDDHKTRDQANALGSAKGNRVVIGIQPEHPELVIRSPRTGDRFRPLGCPGTKSLKKYLMERKVAKVDRDRTPLLVRVHAPHLGDAAANTGQGSSFSDEILWVAGHGISEAARFDSNNLRLRLEWVTR